MADLDRIREQYRLKAEALADHPDRLLMAAAFAFVRAWLGGLGRSLIRRGRAVEDPHEGYLSLDSICSVEEGPGRGRPGHRPAVSTRITLAMRAAWLLDWLREEDENPVPIAVRRGPEGWIAEGGARTRLLLARLRDRGVRDLRVSLVPAVATPPRPLGSGSTFPGRGGLRCPPRRRPPRRTTPRRPCPA